MTALVPRLHKYAIELYEALFDASELTNPKDLPEFGLPGKEKVWIFHGKMVEVSKTRGLTKPQTYEASGLLYRIRSVTRLAASTPWKDGYWLLEYKPTPQQLKDFGDKNKQLSRKIAPSRMDIILTEIAGLRNRVVELERQLNDHLRGGKTLP